jgi:hypothetical protein
MGFLIAAGLVSTVACTGIAAGLGALSNWVGSSRLRSVFLFGLLAASLWPLGLHYQEVRQGGQRVVEELNRKVEENIDSEHYQPSNVRAARTALTRFTWMVPIGLGSLLLLAFWARRRWPHAILFLPTVGLAIYYPFTDAFFIEPLSHHGYKAYTPLLILDPGKLLIWTSILCCAFQVALFAYGAVVSTAVAEEN